MQHLLFYLQPKLLVLTFYVLSFLFLFYTKIRINLISQILRSNVEPSQRFHRNVIMRFVSGVTNNRRQICNLDKRTKQKIKRREEEIERKGRERESVHRTPTLRRRQVDRNGMVRRCTARRQRIPVGRGNKS